MTNTPELTPKHPAFEHEYKGFRVRAFYGDGTSQNADIEIMRDGEPYRSFKYPAYRIWNISAHFSEMIDDVLWQEAEARKETPCPPVSDLTDDEVSRWIAEKLEPGTEKRHVFQPRDMIHDPAMTLMLLEKLLREGWLAGWADTCNLTGHAPMFNLTSPEEVDCWNVELGRAVAEALMLANGYGKEKE